jgi:hypothetical protein
MILATALFVLPMTATVNSVYAETENPKALEDGLYLKMSSIEHQKKFPKGHKEIDGKSCIYDRETDSYFCQYWKEYDGYINR